MRLRRLEFAIIGLTLAFACFIGGFFTGRSWSSVNITAVSTQNGPSVGNSITQIPADQVHQEYSEQQPAAANPVIDITAVPPVNHESGPASENTGAPKEGDGKININLASQSELTDLPGIGSVLASRIVDHRRQHGDFKRIEDIRSVSGIGEKRYEAIKDKITVGIN